MKINKFLPLLLCCGVCLTAQAADSLRYKIAQMLVAGFRGKHLTPDSHIYSDIKKLRIGGVILFDYDVPKKIYDRNIESPAQVKELCNDLQRLSDGVLWIAIDQEGGRVSRLKTERGFAPSVTAQYLGRLDNADSTRHYAQLCAQQLQNLGINLNFSPCVDLNITPNNPVIGRVQRSFSDRADIVGRHAALWIEEHRKRHILTSPKHFPGHGSSSTDTHLGIADVTQTYTAAELSPYRFLIERGLCDMIMVSHVFNRKMDADYPSTLSRKIIHGIIRKQLRYDGLVVTDDLAMGAIVEHYSLETALEKAVNAGADILVLSNNGKTYDAQIAAKAIDIIERLVRQGVIARSRIDEAYRRIANAKTQYLP